MKTLNNVLVLFLRQWSNFPAQKTKFSFTNLPIAPFLLASQSIIQLVSLNVDQLEAEEIYVSVFASILVALVILCIAKLIFRSWSRANAVAAMVTISFFSFGELASFLTFMRKADRQQTNLEAMLIYILLIGLWGVVISIMKQPQQANLIFNIMSIIFLGQSVVQLQNHGFQIKTLFDNQDTPSIAPIHVSSIAVEQPDIYYIILDGYGRHDILKEIYALDNSDFLNSLKMQGFYVATDSNANYIQTFLSVTSSLNMAPIQDMRLGNKRITNRKQLYEMASNSEVRRLLAEHGYRMIAFQNSYSLSITNADIYHDSVPIRPFYSLLIDTTMLRIVLGDRLIGRSYDLHRDTIMFTINTLKTIPKQQGNYFVFAHILLPHPPFVFTSDCQVIEGSESFTLVDGSDYLDYHSRLQYVEGYRMQVQCANRLILDAISEILKNSYPAPIIIIQGDHGPGLDLDWESFENSNIYERLGILNAYYFPDQDYHQLYPRVSPVNSFRIVLNQFFDQNYPLLQDYHYYSPWNRPFEFHEAVFTGQ